MKAIGGYFELDQFVDNSYHKDMIKLNTGRNALMYLIKARKIKKLYIPSFLCDSIENILIKNNILYDHYQIDHSLLPKFNTTLAEHEYILIVNYYGQISTDRIMVLKQTYQNMILDNTHAFFQRPIKGIDTFYSCRKFFGVPDGAYLASDMILTEDIAVDISHKRMKHILGRYEENAEDHYQEFKQNDQDFKDLPLRYMSSLTDNILRAIDYQQVLKTRNDNCAYLASILDRSNRLKLRRVNGPFAYPYLIYGGIKVRNELIKKRIYIPTLWPNVIKTCDQTSIDYDLAANILVLPCDQRYHVDDLKLMIKQVNRCII